MKLNFFIICAAIATTADAQRVTVTRTVTRTTTKTVTSSKSFTVTQTKTLSITVSQCPATTTKPPPTTTTSTIPPRPTDETRCGTQNGQVSGWCPEGQVCRPYNVGPFYCAAFSRACGPDEDLGWHDDGWCAGQKVCVCDYDWNFNPPRRCYCKDPNPPACGIGQYGECRDKTKPKCIKQSCTYGDYGDAYCDYACGV